MAATYGAMADAITTAADQNSLSIHNNHATNIVKVYRIWAQNSRVSTVTGAITVFRLAYYTNASAPTGGSTITPFLYDTNSAALASIDVGSGRTTNLTYSSSNVFRSVALANDEMAVSSATLDELNGFFPFTWGCIWDSGYANSTIQPITLREDQGLILRCVTLGVASTMSFHIEFTVT